MARAKFKKGEQRKFLTAVLKKLNCPSLRALNQFGFEISYSTLKNYYSEWRTIPQELFANLCYLSKTDPNSVDYQILEENWGQKEGGRANKKCERKRLNT
ncbi:hypothetical protein COU58_04430 [Candidatus Pacearchaeota archaeon CG10_big_fil_rev_8_21_14_0_10_32_42]|nr:MAG: hypothetical protein COU58_04430 [Candidatus Pacearchaeota archaeon CG10_big_fil_rev_8_21_14_0_10_32_42]